MPNPDVQLIAKLRLGVNGVSVQHLVVRISICLFQSFPSFDFDHQVEEKVQEYGE